ncbi:hypothetical protein TrRE_jg9392 [Triparma retinervis]|uniref:peptidylprolyl isomerase n=1 Tax=Triparma retinervis TaxID=2557542 RepID=A0A9W7A118_9STRA|nr:hypothetical protein TrRE_jg9392 [Triparma retinervis]
MVPSLTNTATIAILYLSIYSGLNSVVNSLTPSPKPTPRSFTRRAVITAAPLVAGGISFLGFPINSQALVPGALPPPPKKKVGGGEKTCKTIDECMEQREKQEREAASEAPQVEVFSQGGVRFIRLRDGEGDPEGLKDGESASVKFNVLKAGKRSADGLSGQGTSVFSMGYMLEDDEKPDASFAFSTSDSSVIPALRIGSVGMRVGEVRRITLSPSMGWRRASIACDGGPGGRGAGGDVKTDYVIVPTAEIVDQEKCFDRGLKPR